MTQEKRSDKPVVNIKHSSYQPSKAELEEDVSIDASPEDIARAVGRQVRVRHTKPTPPKRETPPSA